MVTLSDRKLVSRMNALRRLNRLYPVSEMQFNYAAQKGLIETVKLGDTDRRNGYRIFIEESEVERLEREGWPIK